MTLASTLLRTLFVIVLTLTVAACSDSSTEIASPGTTGPNPGTGGGGGGGDDGDDGGEPPPSAGNCPTGTTDITVGTATHCELSGTITSDVTLTAGNLYSLNGPVFVGEATASDGTGGTPAVLTIPAGVTVYAQDLGGALFVSRGSRIEADGTQNSPIIFTSSQDLGIAAEFGLTQRAIHTGDAVDDPNTSEWGGLAINGLATLNTCNQNGICEEQGEGDSGLYGGNNDADNSGTLRYVQVKYAGNPITATNELNSIAMQGVGSGTTVDFIHIHNGADDGIEFFGGTVNVKHIVVSGYDDDAIDWTHGYRGKIQHAIVLTNDNFPNADRAIEADNLEGNNDFLPRSGPSLSNMTFIGSSVVADTGIVLRRGTTARIWNTVISNWRDACYDLDSAATFVAAGSSATNLTGATTIESTLFSCNDPTDDDEAEDTFNLAAFVQGQANNVFATASLQGFVNGPAEGAITATDVSQIDSFFDSVDYIGAVPTATAPGNWTLGWTFKLNEAAVCPDTTTPNGADECILEGTITEDTRLVAGFDYLLRGAVFIGEDAGPDPDAPLATADPAVLTVDPGVRILGEDTGSALFISRGSQIFANGTADAPIIMSHISDDTANLDTDVGLWGGFAINGRAVLNTCNQTGVCEEQGEGDSGAYGGVDDTDNSGRMTYVVIKYAGFPITATNELNAFAAQGVGSGTEIDYLQIHNAADDGIEFFGGTLSVKHLVVTQWDDDGIDWTHGWRGKIQHAVVYSGDTFPNLDRAIEADNLEGNNDFLPRSQGLIANVTFVGSDQIGDTGIVLRRGTTARIWNAVVDTWRDACYDLDSAATFVAAGSSATNLTGATTVVSTQLTCNDPTEDNEAEDTFNTQNFVINQANNRIQGDPPVNLSGGSLQAPTGGSRTFINGPTENAGVATNVNAIDSFFDNTSYIGAVQNNANNWTAGWTVWLND